MPPAKPASSSDQEARGTPDPNKLALETRRPTESPRSARVAGGSAAVVVVGDGRSSASGWARPTGFDASARASRREEESSRSRWSGPPSPTSPGTVVGQPGAARPRGHWRHRRWFGPRRPRVGRRDSLAKVHGSTDGSTSPVPPLRPAWPASAEELGARRGVTLVSVSSRSASGGGRCPVRFESPRPGHDPSHRAQPGPRQGPSALTGSGSQDILGQPRDPRDGPSGPVPGRRGDHQKHIWLKGGRSGRRERAQQGPLQRQRRRRR